MMKLWTWLTALQPGEQEAYESLTRSKFVVYDNYCIDMGYSRWFAFICVKLWP